MADSQAIFDMFSQANVNNMFALAQANNIPSANAPALTQINQIIQNSVLSANVQENGNMSIGYNDIARRNVSGGNRAHLQPSPSHSQVQAQVRIPARPYPNNVQVRQAIPVQQRYPIPVQSAGPAENLAIIRNTAEYLQRHRNATIRSCYHPTKKPLIERSTKTLYVRTVKDSGREGTTSVVMNIACDPIAPEPSMFQDVPRSLAPSQLRLLPIGVFSASMAAEECVVCFSDYEVGDNIIITPCGHRVHTACATQWFEQSTSCPTCREPCGLSQHSLQSTPSPPVRSNASVGRR